FKRVEFGLIEGDKAVRKTITRWSDTGADGIWSTFNGTDEDNEHGVGTIYTEDGAFFYRIDDGGTVDWHNKLIGGSRETPLTLTAGSYYTVEITAKATAPVSCAFYLNPLGTWDPRIAEEVRFTTEEKTFSFSTDRPFTSDMDVEMLFQFGSEATSQLDSVTIEFTDITIYQESVN
ncbi:MAG: hypothetical protein ACSW8F_00395, partial [bacterium]